MGQAFGESVERGLAQLYATLPGGFVIPCFEPVLTTHDGLPLAIMAGTKALQVLTTPRKLMPITLENVSAEPPSADPPLRATPALQNRKFGAPSFAMTVSAKEDTATASATSHTLPCAEAPRAAAASITA